MVKVVAEIEARVWLTERFPALAAGGFQITSAPTPEYNCIAWAIGDNEHFWWPGTHWPKTAGKKATRENFVRAFKLKGFELCENGNPEPGFEKIVLFEKDGAPTHAARLLPDGNWTSKMGSFHDISHKLEGLEGQVYGRATLFFKRKLVQPALEG